MRNYLRAVPDPPAPGRIRRPRDRSKEKTRHLAGSCLMAGCGAFYSSSWRRQCAGSVEQPLRVLSKRAGYGAQVSPDCSRHRGTGLLVAGTGRLVSTASVARVMHRAAAKPHDLRCGRIARIAGKTNPVRSPPTPANSSTIRGVTSWQGVLPRRTTMGGYLRSVSGGTDPVEFERSPIDRALSGARWSRKTVECRFSTVFSSSTRCESSTRTGKRSRSRKRFLRQIKGLEGLCV